MILKKGVNKMVKAVENCILRTHQVREKFLGPRKFLGGLDRSFKIREGLTLEEAVEKLVPSKFLKDVKKGRIHVETDQTLDLDFMPTEGVIEEPLKDFEKQVREARKNVKSLLEIVGFMNGKISVRLLRLALFFDTLSKEGGEITAPPYLVEALKVWEKRGPKLIDLIVKREKWTGVESLEQRIKITMHAIVGRIGDKKQVLELIQK